MCTEATLLCTQASLCYVCISIEDGAIKRKEKKNKRMKKKE